ncbi:spermidine/putrescine ABC transporter substrate-binding protein [Endozoicomonas montiporae]|uniref:Putrescine-binding periplasmic protein n=2 Tax=Endozoicomonas montiporae TaxID=1027273 RepID=A0A081N5A7_9GAMM|nr:polyamine ABC transporter substrate-binding protein [Endozoicomonas montiporae]AMO57487.1 putrescine transport system substrate-binding protein [Endozoicomonas montiporae CL-33]KEQ13630.1 spermidine/putrescine ABC transporter substrate-binding protein [Endozoicomonas montiporae]
MIKKLLTHSLMASTLALSSLTMANDKTLNIYNWSDYIAEDTIANFEKKTGIKVRYDVFDSNEVLEAKLLSGKTGYDIVVPSAMFMARQIQAGVFAPLEKDKLEGWKNLDNNLLKRLEIYDNNNDHAFPYLWGTTGIGYNPDLVKKHLGSAAPLDSWDLLFKEENISKLSQCGVAVLNAPTEVIPAALQYLGLDPNSKKKGDYAKAEQLLQTIRPHITYFHSSKFISDLANGDVCVALGWSGDILQASDRAAEADNGITVEYVIPKEGAGMWFDMLAIPKDAENVEEAYAFLNYLLEPEVMAEISNYVSYASGNSAAVSLLDDGIVQHPGIYPSREAEENLYVFEVLPPKINRLVNRTFTKVTTGQ